MERSSLQKTEKNLRLLFFVFVLAAVSAACITSSDTSWGLSSDRPTITPIINSGEDQQVAPENPVETAMPGEENIVVEPTISSSPTPGVSGLWIAPYLPAEIITGLVAPFPITLVDQAESANLILDIGESNVITRVVYAMVAPFPSMDDEVTADALIQAWSGTSNSQFLGTHLYVSEATYVVFTRWWGTPVGDFVRVTSEDAILESAWAEGSAWALVPFEALEPRWKVIAVDGDSPIWKSFDVESYRLSVPISVTGDNPEEASALAAAFQLIVPSVYNRDAEKMTTVILTGVTALVRATAAEMEVRGILYPATDLGDILREADILHISNEIPFSESCPQPNPGQATLVFCSSPDYIELLQDIGTDVIELTGDHFGDWGTAAVLYTLDLYDEIGMAYYGGGETVEEAQAAQIFEHNGNQIAFVGCNAKGGNYTPLASGLPGAVDCRFEDVVPLLNQLDQEGYVTIMTFQHFEYYYFDPNYVLEQDFRLVADAGADIVSGSQAHQPHGLEFYRGSTLFYGLGNMFFDQLTVSEDTARALITRNVIYDNQYISSEIITIFFADYSRPRFLLGDGRIDLLANVFYFSNWDLLYGGN